MPAAGSGTNVLDETEILQESHSKDHNTLSVILPSITGGIETSSLESEAFRRRCSCCSLKVKNITALVERERGMTGRTISVTVSKQKSSVV